MERSIVERRASMKLSSRTGSNDGCLMLNDGSGTPAAETVLFQMFLIDCELNADFAYSEC